MLTSEIKKRGIYVDLTIEIIYQHGCITKTRIINIIADKLGKPRKTIENSVSKCLSRLVKRGIIQRPVSGVYCKPGFRVE